MSETSKKESLFVTGADQLLDMVKRYKSLPVEVAAKKLGVSPEVIEDWAYDIEMYSKSLHTVVRERSKYLVIGKR